MTWFHLTIKKGKRKKRAHKKWMKKSGALEWLREVEKRVAKPAKEVFEEEHTGIWTNYPYCGWQYSVPDVIQKYHEERLKEEEDEGKFIWQTGYYSQRKFSKRVGNDLRYYWETTHHNIDGSVKSVKITEGIGIKNFYADHKDLTGRVNI